VALTTEFPPPPPPSSAEVEKREELSLYSPSEPSWRPVPRRTFDFRRVRKIAKSDYYLRHVRLSAWNNSAPTGRILMKHDI
jgi:hypothetical protein